MFMAMLALTSIPKSVTGQSMIVEMVSKMIDLEKEFKAEEEEMIEKIIQCLQASSEYFSVSTKSSF